jgi:hypothetical protein
MVGSGVGPRILMPRSVRALDRLLQAPEPDPAVGQAGDGVD